MNRQCYGQVGSVVIHIELGIGGTVVPQGIQDSGIAGIASFNQMKLFQKIADSSVAVYGRGNIKRGNSLVRNASVKARKTRDGNTLWCDSDGNWFIDLIGAVVDSIGKQFFYSRIGIVINFDRFGFVRFFDDGFFQNIVFDIC